MTYGSWIIGGVTPSWIETVDYNLGDNKISLKCAAFYDETGNDPRVEIKSFEDMACQTINNTPLLNGGTVLEVVGGSIITVTDGVETWRAALHPPTYTEDNAAAKGIEYTLDLEVRKTATGGYNLYTPSFRGYSNISQYEYYDGGVKSSASPTDGAYGSEIGWMQITEERNVKRVDVYGSACNKPASITVNGVTQSWVKCHDRPACTNYGYERLVWNLNTPSKTVTLSTTGHGDPTPRHGCWIQWIRVLYE